MDIMTYIGVGKEAAITRSELARLTNLPDRKVREQIEAARRNGELIVNAGDGAGYYISDNIDELTRQYRMNENRAMSILVQKKFLRRRIKELKEQEEKKC